MQPTGQQRHAPPAPAVDTTTEQGPPPAAPPVDTTTEAEVAALFDDRPADDTSTDKPNLLLRALAHLKSGVARASAWLERLFYGEIFGRSPTLQIGKPQDVKKKDLPENLVKALAELEADKAKKEAAQTPIASANRSLISAVPNEDVDKKAFDDYVRLCATNSKEPGAMECPQNFLEGAVRHAERFVELVDERRRQSDQAGQDFWLSTEDQQRYKASALLLTHQHGPSLKKAGEQALQQMPIQTHTQQQCVSFMAWRGSKDKPEALQANPGFSLDAARAYALELIAQHAGTGNAQSEPLKSMLQDASQLVAEFEKIKYGMAVAIAIDQEVQDILSQLKELKATPGSSPSDMGPPPPPPPPRKVKTVSADSPGGNANAPAPPPARVTTVKPRTLAVSKNIPQLATFDDEIQKQGSVLLQQFFQQYVDQLERGNVEFADNSVYFSIHVVAAAADFLDKASASAADVPAIDPRAYAAANYLVAGFGKLRDKKS